MIGQHQAGFTSAIILAMITLLIGYESFSRILSAVSIHFAEAIPIAFLGLAVNVASAWLLAGGDYHHGHHRELGCATERSAATPSGHVINSAPLSVLWTLIVFSTIPKSSSFFSNCPTMPSCSSMPSALGPRPAFPSDSGLRCVQMCIRVELK